MVLQILTQSMQPLLASLQAWLYDGLLQGSPHNFFICDGGDRSCHSAWSNGPAGAKHKASCHASVTKDSCSPIALKAAEHMPVEGSHQRTVISLCKTVLF